MEKTLFINPASTELVLCTALATLFFFCVVPGVIRKFLYSNVTKVDLAMLIIAGLVGGGMMSYFTHEVFGWPLFTIVFFALPGIIYVIGDMVYSHLKALQRDATNKEEV